MAAHSLPSFFPEPPDGHVRVYQIQAITHLAGGPNSGPQFSNFIFLGHRVVPTQSKVCDIIYEDGIRFGLFGNDEIQLLKGKDLLVSTNGIVGHWRMNTPRSATFPPLGALFVFILPGQCFPIRSSFLSVIPDLLLFLPNPPTARPTMLSHPLLLRCHTDNQ